MIAVVPGQPITSRDARHSSASVDHYTPPAVTEAARKVLGRVDLDPASSERANTLVQAKRIFTLEDNGFARPWHGLIFLNPPGGLCDRDGRRVVRKSGGRQEGCTVTGACGLPPGHKHEGVTSSAKAWWFKLMREIEMGNVEAGFFVGFSLEILQTTQHDRPYSFDGERPLASPLDYPICVPSQRIDYWVEKPDGTLGPEGQPTHSSFFALAISGLSSRDQVDRILFFDREFSKFGKVRS